MGRRVWLGFIIAQLMACGAPQTGDGEDGEPTIFRTIVTRNVDGTETVSEVQITRAQQVAELAAHKRLAGVPAVDDGVGQLAQGLNLRDSGCAGSSMWIFDAPNFTGNEICFAGEGPANLDYYSRLICSRTTCWTLTWGAAARSYYSGTESGYFKYQPGGFGTVYYPEYYGAYQSVPVAGSYAQGAQFLINTN